MKATKKINVRLLRKVEKHILQEPKSVNMGIFLVKKGNQIRESRYYDFPKCGTIGCIAGWACVLGKVKNPERDVYLKAIKLLNLTQNQADNLFFPNNWPDEFEEKLDSTDEQTLRYAKVIVARVEHFIKTKGNE